jgi:hypothetical protein
MWARDPRAEAKPVLLQLTVCIMAGNRTSSSPQLTFSRFTITFNYLVVSFRFLVDQSEYGLFYGYAVHFLYYLFSEVCISNCSPHFRTSAPPYCGHTNRLWKCRLKKLRICSCVFSKLDFRTSVTWTGSVETCNMDMQGRHELWACSMDMQHLQYICTVQYISKSKKYFQ